MPIDPTSQFLREGLLGAIIVVLAGVCALLYRENRSLSKDLRLEVEKRVQDLILIKDAYYTFTTQLKESYFASLEGVKNISQNTLNIVELLKERIK